MHVMKNKISRKATIINLIKSVGQESVESTKGKEGEKKKRYLVVSDRNLLIEPSIGSD